jgi:tetratricopeptide (TPR) repeat protein
VPKEPSRPVANKEEPDLRPPEEIRARRIRRFVLIGVLAACVAGVAIYFAGPPIGGAIKAWQSRRLAREAFALIDQKKWNEAAAKARDAYILRFTEPESWRAVARVATRTGQWAAALEWWKKVDDAHRLTAEDRRDLIAAAIMSGEIALSANQVEELLAQRTGPAPLDIVWAGQVAARQNNPQLALDYAQRVLADKRAKSQEILSAATLVLSVTSPYSDPYARAWKQIEDIARDPKNPGSLDALVVVAREDGVPPQSPPGANPSLSLESTPVTSATPAPPPSVAGGVDAGPTLHQPTPATQSGDTVTLDLAATPPPASAGRTMSLTEVAKALENHPDARPSHKLLALEVRARQDPILTDQFVADAVERFGNAARLAQVYEGGAEQADETLTALAGWLNKIGRPAKTLEVLPQARALQRADLFSQYINALAALQRWNDIKDLLMSEHSVVDPVTQHMYLAVAQVHLGSATAATNEWQRALQVANTAQKLLALAGYAEQNSVNDIADAAYSEAIKLAPNNRAAYTGRLRLALNAGRTAGAQEIAAEIARLWPDDAAARNQDSYLRLLLGASGEQAEAAERDAEVLVAKEPRNWQARATLGLARLRLDRPKDALAAIREPRVTGGEPAGALAVRAAILAANGYEEGARNDARLVTAKPLLPEERALIVPLLQ